MGDGTEQQRNDLTKEDVSSAFTRLTKAMATFKRTKKHYDKQEVVGAYIQIVAMRKPTTFDRKTTRGMQNRHQLRDSLHALEEDAFLRTVSEIFMDTEGVTN